MYKLVSIVILFLIGGTAIVQGQEWLTPTQYDNTGSSYFPDPFIYPWNSQAERASYESQYYPYFGEDFFRTDTNPHQHSQEAIAAQKTELRKPLYTLFWGYVLKLGRKLST
jgi:hypothetical protein